MVKRKKKKGKLFLVFVLIFLSILSSFLTISSLRISEKREGLKKKISEYKREFEVLENKNQFLKTQISKSKNEDYWEEVAREQGYQRPGEKQVVILPAEEKTVEKEKKKGLFENFLDWLKEELKIGK
jgi:cell division protein FtsB